MAQQPRQFRPPGWKPKEQRDREFDAHRGSASSRGYGAAWVAASAGHRRSEPLCRYCKAGAFGEPRIRAAQLVDHFVPHRGDQVIFWRRDLWVSSCSECHSGPKQAVERQGRAALVALARRLGLDPDLAWPPA
jgi:5-methylcytosine-specific restriction protein A